MFGDPGQGRRQLAGFLDRVVGQGHVRRLAGKEVDPCRPRLFPVLAEFAEQAWRERDQTLLAALALADVDLHATAVDVAHLQVSGFAQSQAGRILSQQDGAMFERGYTCHQPNDFLGSQDGRQLLGPLAKWNLLHGPGPGQRDVVEEA